MFEDINGDELVEFNRMLNFPTVDDDGWNLDEKERLTLFNKSSSISAYSAVSLFPYLLCTKYNELKTF